MRRVEETVCGGVTWQERAYPRQWWRRLFVRTLARAMVLAPDGRRYTVRVVRIFWPGGHGSTLTAGWPIETIEVVPAVVETRVVWGVRVLGESTRSRVRPLVYGEEMRSPDRALLRARA